MELKAQEDINAPAERVFAGLTDFDALVTQAVRRGLSVTRLDKAATAGEGSAWDVGFSMRGKQRQATVTVARFTPPEVVGFHFVTGGLEISSQIDVVAVSPDVTRLIWVSTLAPKTLSARLMVQSMKLARGGIENRFRQRMAGFAREFEERLIKG